MTFIASVVAKKGVAVIADSLVTTSAPIIEYDDFRKMLEDKLKKSKSKTGKVSFDGKDIASLFKTKPSHSKNYEEKLFKYDEYTAITIAGSAEIGGVRVGSLINELIERNKKNKSSYSKKKFTTKIKDFKEFIIEKVKLHIADNKISRQTVFIITHFDKDTENTIIHKIIVKRVSQDMLNNNPNTELLTEEINGDHSKVVCDWQNKISERILWGEIDFIIAIVPKIFEFIEEDFKSIKNKLTRDYTFGIIKKLMSESYVNEDIKMNKLTDLSLQQAVDLACLLMRIEVDIQKFTENIQTVGGVIKVATIDKKGFNFIIGDSIEIPNSI